MKEEKQKEHHFTIQNIQLKRGLIKKRTPLLPNLTPHL
jgi:hypothetical protein